MMEFRNDLAYLEEVIKRRNERIAELEAKSQYWESRYLSDTQSRESALAVEEERDRLRELLIETQDGCFLGDDDFPSTLPKYLYDKITALLREGE